MKKAFKNLLTDNSIKYSIISSIVLSTIDIIIILFFLKRFPPFIPFFNSLPWGQQRLANSNFIVFLIIAFFSIILINSVLSSFLYAKYALLSRILAVTSLLFVFLGFLASIQIIFLIF